MYYFACEIPLDYINMVYGVSKELSHKILVHNLCSLKLWIVRSQ